MTRSGVIEIAATVAELRLASRLRQLREEWPHGRVTQAQVAKAFKVSPQQVSSWESGKSPQVLSQERLQDYGCFFATPRSMAGGKPRLIAAAELTDEERGRLDQIVSELEGLREAALGPLSVAPRREGFLRFSDGRPIYIIGSRQPLGVIRAIPEADERHPDHVHLMHHADADAVMELFGELRAENPDTVVRYLLPDEVNSTHLRAHLFILGGYSVNRYSQWFAARTGVPVECGAPGLPAGFDPDEWAQRRFTVPSRLHPDAASAESEVSEDGERLVVFRAELNGTVKVPRRGLVAEGEPETEIVPNLYRDVALIARQPNPEEPEATATLIHGLFSRGTYGAVRCFVDPDYRSKNEEYLRSRFSASDQFWLLINVTCDRDLPIPVTLTPDLTRDDTRIMEWTA